MPEKINLLVKLLREHNWSWDATDSPVEYLLGSERDSQIKELADEIGPKGWKLFRRFQQGV